MARTPCRSRAAPRRSTAPRQLAAPRNSPAWGVETRPADVARRKASSKSSGGKGPSPLSLQPSEACSPKETTGSPAFAMSTASCAVHITASGPNVRTAGTIQRMTTPVFASAAFPADSTTSQTARSEGMGHVSAKMPAAPKAGSMYTTPSAMASSAISLIIRSMSLGSRTKSKHVAATEPSKSSNDE
eukprot:CAMPEP_0172768624 /NCGR_PEP_ID=MMETSP1074-20121228/185142_1 /TAXON_ID=2916 /ORGANISM="Ceratium fusus, Strain PA161109" /LENGTH=186 /DNA_ID=CAMNT_0013604063 /DNA_START=380 /DNA_END=940 /DNA_ORIENTATION=+